MIKSFIDLINESNELPLNQTGIVGEMGVKRPERLSGSTMGTRRQETETRRQQMAQTPPRRSYMEVAVELTKLFKRLRWQDIRIETPANERKHFPRFDVDIVRVMTELYAIDQNTATRDFGRWRDAYPTSMDAIYFKTEVPSEFQRSHFPNGGIPSSLRGIGLGFKLYRALLREMKYLRSDTGATNEAQKAWGSMLSYKANPDGSPSEDDAYAIIGQSNWLALDKQTCPQRDVISIAQRFIEERIHVSNTTPNKFDMDDDLIAMLPNEFLVQLSPEYTLSLKNDSRITAAKYAEIEGLRSDMDRIRLERAEREELERRERTAREEASTRARLADRIRQYGAEPDADWQLGDYIVVKQYLYQSDYRDLPIRKVKYESNGTYKAVYIRDAMRMELGEININGASDVRETNDKTRWIKVNLDQIPDLNAISLQPAEKQYVERQINPEVMAAHKRKRAEAEAARIEQERQANARRLEDERRRAETTATQGEEAEADLSIFGVIPHSGMELKQKVWTDRKRDNAIWDVLKIFKNSAFSQFFVLNTEQKQLLRENYGVGVYVPYRQVGRVFSRSNIRPIADPNELLSGDDRIGLINLATGHKIPAPYAGLGLTAYRLEAVTMADKLALRPGTHYYIASNDNNFGIFAKATRQRKNTQNQPFIYLNCYGYSQNDIQVQLRDLMKVSEIIEL